MPGRDSVGAGLDDRDEHQLLTGGDGRGRGGQGGGGGHSEQGTSGLLRGFYVSENKCMQLGCQLFCHGRALQNIRLPLFHKIES